MSLNDYVRRLRFEHDVVDYYDLVGCLPASAEKMMYDIEDPLNEGIFDDNYLSPEEQGTRDALVALDFIKRYRPFPWIHAYYRITPKWDEYLRCKDNPQSL